MASSINPTLPLDGTPAVKADLRANLAFARNEIEALQAGKADSTHTHPAVDVTGLGALAALDTITAAALIDDAIITPAKLVDQAGFTAGAFSAANVTLNQQGIITDIENGLTSSGLTVTDDNNTAITIGNANAGTMRVLINAGAITLTLDNTASVGTRVGALKATDGVITMGVAGGAGYRLPGASRGSVAITSNLILHGYMEFIVETNAGGVAAEWRVFGQDDIADVLDADLDVNGKSLLGVGMASQLPFCFAITCSDNATPIAVGTGKATAYAPFAMTVLEVIATAITAPTGAALVIDINEAGTTIISTKLSIDAGEETSLTAATPAVISDAAVAKGAKLTVDFDQVGSTVAGAGIVVYVIGRTA